MINTRSNGYLGCDSHYSPEGHAALAADVTPKIAELLSWESDAGGADDDVGHSDGGDGDGAGGSGGAHPVSSPTMSAEAGQRSDDGGSGSGSDGLAPVPTTALTRSGSDGEDDFAARAPTRAPPARPGGGNGTHGGGGGGGGGGAVSTLMEAAALALVATLALTAAAGAVCVARRRRRAQTKALQEALSGPSHALGGLLGALDEVELVEGEDVWLRSIQRSGVSMAH